MSAFWRKVRQHSNIYSWVTGTQATRHYPTHQLLVPMRSTRQPAFMSMSTSLWHRYELPRCSLTHWGPSNMAAILQTTISNAFSWMKIFEFKGTINNTSALIRIMAWHRIGDKSLSEPMVAYFSDAYIRQSASLSWHIVDLTKWPTWLQTTFDLNENQGGFLKIHLEFIVTLILRVPDLPKSCSHLTFQTAWAAG